MKTLPITFLIIVLTFVSNGISEEEVSSVDPVVEAAGDMLEMLLGMSFTMAERADSPSDARDVVNIFAFRYYLLCRGEKAILPPNPEIENGLAYQRSKRLRVSELKSDPFDFKGSMGARNIEKMNQFAGRTYTVKTIEEYEALVSAFHKWLNALPKR